MATLTPRRAPRAGVIMLGLSIVLVASVTTACGSGADPTPPAPSASSSTPVVPTASPSSSVSPDGRPVRCVDPVGDSTRSGDLTSVDVTEGADAVRVSWTTTTDVAELAATPSSVLFALALVEPGAERASLTFLVKGSEGGFSLPFATRGANESVDALAPVTPEGATLTAVFPPDVLAGLGPSWTFDASLDQQGNDVDRCRG